MACLRRPQVSGELIGHLLLVPVFQRFLSLPRPSPHSQHGGRLGWGERAAKYILPKPRLVLFLSCAACVHPPPAQF